MTPQAAQSIAAAGRAAGLASPGPASPEQLQAVSLLAPFVNQAAAGREKAAGKTAA